MARVGSLKQRKQPTVVIARGDDARGAEIGGTENYARNLASTASFREYEPKYTGAEGGNYHRIDRAKG